jgi:hypothetical protein
VTSSSALGSSEFEQNVEREAIALYMNNGWIRIVFAYYFKPFYCRT